MATETERRLKDIAERLHGIEKILLRIEKQGKEGKAVDLAQEISERLQCNTSLLSPEITKIVVESDEINPATIATITANEADPADGYRIRLTPKYD